MTGKTVIIFPGFPGALGTLPSHGLSCEEGLPDILGGDALDVLGSTGMAVASSAQRSCRDGIDAVGALGISSVPRLTSSPLQGLLGMIELFHLS